MRAGNFKKFDYALCIKDRVDSDRITYHTKGKEYLIQDIFINEKKEKIVQLSSNNNLFVQYSYCEKDNAIFYFNEYFNNKKELRKKKLKKIKNI